VLPGRLELPSGTDHLGSAVHPAAASSPSPDDFLRTLLVSVDLRAGRVQVTGDLDRSCAHHLLDALATLGLSTSTTWTVDAAGVTFCGATGLRVLARARALAASRGRTLVLIGAPPFLARLLAMTRLGDLLSAPPSSYPGGAEPAVRSRVRGQALRCRTKS
jgi:anti-anti-sigma factor